jgi:GNAT superfamily N-acetyltransferase
MAGTIVPILLLPEHAKPNPSNLPVLRGIQTVLNESYTETYCRHPEIFGTSHVRMADPAQLMDIIGPEGFTLILVRVTSTGTDQKPQVCEVVATASVKDFGDGDLETYAKWSKNLGGKQWASKARNEEQIENSGQRKEEGKVPEKSREGLQKLEVTAFGVSPHHQAGGLGARLLNEIKWLVASKMLRGSAANSLPMVEGLGVSDGASILPLEGIDLGQLKSSVTSTEAGRLNQAVQETATPKLVLMAIRELGNEEYYQKRGFRTTWSGPVPVGMWDCRKECTMVYMEMDLEQPAHS